jgi:hypothetical protein
LIKSLKNAEVGYIILQWKGKLWDIKYGQWHSDESSHTTFRSWCFFFPLHCVNEGFSQDYMSDQICIIIMYTYLEAGVLTIQCKPGMILQYSYITFWQVWNKFFIGVCTLDSQLMEWKLFGCRSCIYIT